MRTVARRLLTIMCLTALLLGCGETIESPTQTVGPTVQLATGGSDAGTWTAVIYTGQGGGTCMEFHWAGGTKAGSCGPVGTDFVTRDHGGIWIMGSTKLLAAKSVRVTEDDGSAAGTDAILPPAGVTDGVRYYVTALLGGSEKAKITTVEILDAAGNVLQTRQVNRP
jgi:hypothetical protein